MGRDKMSPLITSLSPSPSLCARSISQHFRGEVTPSLVWWDNKLNTPLFSHSHSVLNCAIVRSVIALLVSSAPSSLALSGLQSHVLRLTPSTDQPARPLKGYRIHWRGWMVFIQRGVCLIYSTQLHYDPNIIEDQLQDHSTNVVISTVNLTVEFTLTIQA